MLVAMQFLKTLLCFTIAQTVVLIFCLVGICKRSWLGVKLRRFDDLNAAAAWIFIIHNLRGLGQKEATRHTHRVIMTQKKNLVLARCQVFVAHADKCRLIPKHNLKDYSKRIGCYRISLHPNSLHLKYTIQEKSCHVFWTFFDE